MSKLPKLKANAAIFLEDGISMKVSENHWEWGWSDERGNASRKIGGGIFKNEKDARKQMRKELRENPIICKHANEMQTQYEQLKIQKT